MHSQINPELLAMTEVERIFKSSNEQKIQFYYREIGNNPISLRKEKLTLHRIDGPAILIVEYSERVFLEEWHFEGKLHRTNGPAMTMLDFQGKIFFQQWWQQGKLLRSEGPFIKEKY